MAVDAFELGEHPGYEASRPIRVGHVAGERFGLGTPGAVVDMMFVGAEVPCATAGRLAEEHDVGRWSHVGVVSRAFSHLALTVVACEIRAAGAGARRAAR